MSGVFVDKPKIIEIHKSLNARPILTSRKRLKLKKIKKIKKIKKKYLRIQKKIKNQENNINKEKIIFNQSLNPKILEKENLNENHFIFKPIQQNNKILFNEENNKEEPRNIINNIKNDTIKKVEHNNLFHNILNLKDNNNQENTNTTQNIPSIQNNNKNNISFDNYMPCEFTFGNLFESEINSSSEIMTHHDSPFIPRTYNFPIDNQFNDFDLFPENQNTFLHNIEKADEFFHFSIPDSFSFNSSNNQNNIPNNIQNSPFRPLLFRRDNNYFSNNNLNNDIITIRNNNNYKSYLPESFPTPLKHHINFNNNSNNILNYNNIINRNPLTHNINNNNSINNTFNLYPNIYSNLNINNINYNYTNNNALNNNRPNNSNNNIRNINNILNRLRPRNDRSNYNHSIEPPLNYYGMGKIKIKQIKEKLHKSRIKNINNLEDNKKNCIICLEDFKNRQMIYTLSCSHTFHVICLNKEIKLRQKCPICRKELK